MHESQLHPPHPLPGYAGQAGDGLAHAFQAASHSTFAIAGVASLSLATVDVGSAAVRPVQGATRQNDAKSDYRWILAGKCPRYISGAPHARDGVLYCAT